MPVIFYACPRCGARCEATVDDVDRSYSIAGAVIKRLRRAARDRDGAAAVALARCPACHARPRGAFVFALARILGNVACGLAVGLAVGALVMAVASSHVQHTDLDLGFPRALVVAVLAVYAAPFLFGVVAVLGELRRLGNVVAVTARHGRAPLPVARVVDS